MLLYLVRWPWMTASLVSARDEDDLLDTLDQVDDAEGATWTVYIEDVEKVEIGEFEVSRPGCDHTSEMHERITRAAFPRLHRLLYGREDEATENEVKAAVYAELERLVNAEWRRAAREKRTDSLGQIAIQMRAPVRQIENILRRSGELPTPAVVQRPPRCIRFGRSGTAHRSVRASSLTSLNQRRTCGHGDKPQNGPAALRAPSRHHGPSAAAGAT